MGQNIAINSTGAAANVSAMLDIVASDKGMLLPRVSLSSNTDAATVSGTEADALIVFNTNGGMTNGNGKGYYYWDLPTLKWIYLAGASNGPGTSGQVLTSLGPTNQPQWITPAAASTAGGGVTGCANCITELSTTTWSNITWATCANNCRTLASDATNASATDWRMPTFDEAVYYRSGALDPPGAWIADYVWTTTITDARVIETAVWSTYLGFYESLGLVAPRTYNIATTACRCVR